MPRVVPGLQDGHDGASSENTWPVSVHPRLSAGSSLRLLPGCGGGVAPDCLPAGWTDHPRFASQEEGLGSTLALDGGGGSAHVPYSSPPRGGVGGLTARSLKMKLCSFAHSIASWRFAQPLPS